MSSNGINKLTQGGDSFLVRKFINTVYAVPKLTRLIRETKL